VCVFKHSGQRGNEHSLFKQMFVSRFFGWKKQL
jgi:hypothetical protein